MQSKSLADFRRNINFALSKEMTVIFVYEQVKLRALFFINLSLQGLVTMYLGAIRNNKSVFFYITYFMTAQ